MKRAAILLVLLFGVGYCRAQSTKSVKADSLFRHRIWITTGGSVALYGTSLLLLNHYWYQYYPRSGFHFFNDLPEWNQVDKAGHAFTAYQASRLSAQIWRWTGFSENKSAWIGGLTGLGYQTVIEVLDGFSSQWGFSAGDMLANVGGTGLFLGQELGWHEQRIQLKFSTHINRYTADPAVRERTTELFGKPYLERLLKDYNAQTYWLSFHIKSFLPDSKWPAWLNLAVGYGAENMYGGRDNRWEIAPGDTLDYSNIRRFRQFYLSPDIDFTKIQSRRKGVRVLLQVLNMIKIPAPALEVNSAGKLKLHALCF